MKEGLQPTPQDERDFPLADDPVGGIWGITTLPKLEELRVVCVVEPISLKDQGDTDFCAAFASTLASEVQEEIELSPEWQFAVAKVHAGKDPDEWGIDLRSMLNSLVKLGSVPQKEAPYSLENKPDSFLRRIGNWPVTLYETAKGHKKKTYFKITGPYDHYDNIRASIWKFRDKRQMVVSGLKWQWPLDQYHLTTHDGDGFGHAIAYIGWSNEGIVAQNSAGKRAGKNGRHALSRNVINHFVEKYGAYMLVDISPDEAKYYLDNGIKLEDSWIVGIFKALWKFVTNLLR